LAVEHQGKDEELAERRKKFHTTSKEEEKKYKEKISEMNERVAKSTYSFQNCKQLKIVHIFKLVRQHSK
jgi:hypothetical protein